MIKQITPLILTWNEEANIGRTIERLQWATEVVVIDSGSTDATREICEAFPNVRFVVRSFDHHATQWNFGLKETGVTADWVLALDADYLLSDALVAELQSLVLRDQPSAYRLSVCYCVNGRALSGSIYPPVIGLYRRDRAHYEQDGHTQRVVVDGEVGALQSVVFHDDRKPLGRWLQAQDRYAGLECDLLTARKWADLRTTDRLRRLIVVAPWLVPLYCLTARKGFLDGWPGLYYALQRGVAESILALKLIERKLMPNPGRGCMP